MKEIWQPIRRSDVGKSEGRRQRSLNLTLVSFLAHRWVTCGPPTYCWNPHLCRYKASHGSLSLEFVQSGRSKWFGRPNVIGFWLSMTSAALTALPFIPRYVKSNEFCIKSQHQLLSLIVTLSATNQVSPLTKNSNSGVQQPWSYQEDYSLWLDSAVTLRKLELRFQFLFQN